MSQRPSQPQPIDTILEIAPYIGGDAKLVDQSSVLRLAANENPLGPSIKAQAAMMQAAADQHRYPEGGSTELRAALAKHHKVSADQIVCGSGSDEVISLLTAAYVRPGEETIYSAHGFLMYPIASKVSGGTPNKIAESATLYADLDAILDAVTDKTRIVFLANPNNPTGSLLSAQALAEFHAKLPSDILLILDGAYAEYVTDPNYDPGFALVDSAKNVVMTRTFSKCYGLAGLRLGWAYASPEVADVLNRVRGPFNVSYMAQVAGLAALQDQEHIEQTIALNTRVRETFSADCRELGLEVIPSQGNFVLVRFPNDQGRNVTADAYLRENGILVRQMASYGLPDCLRIGLGTPEDMRRVTQTLKAFLS